MTLQMFSGIRTRGADDFRGPAVGKLRRRLFCLTLHYDVDIVSAMELTTMQVAEKLGVSQARIRALVRAGRIKARHLTPRMLLIDERELAKVKNRKPGRPTTKGKKVSR